MINADNRECMTVGELIAHLQKFDPNLPVIYKKCSDYSELCEEDIEVETAESQRIVYRKEQGFTGFDSRWHKEPDYRTVLVLPGN